MEDFKCICGGQMVEGTTRMTTQDPDFLVVDDVPCQKCVVCSQTYLTPQVTKQLVGLAKQPRQGSDPPLVAVRQIRFTKGVTTEAGGGKIWV